MGSEHLNVTDSILDLFSRGLLDFDCSRFGIFAVKERTKIGSGALPIITLSGRMQEHAPILNNL
jgi:hypothetical protein